MTAARPATKRATDTRTALLRAAEELFAARGVDGVSMREIAAAAGQANHSAAHYHFANKRDLVNALLERHSEPMQLSWLSTVTHMEAEGRDSLRELVALLVRPLVAKLDDPDGGANYLLVVADLVSSRSFPITTMPAVSALGILADSARMMRHIPSIPPDLLQLRMMRVAAVLYCSIANYHGLIQDGFVIPREIFVNDLINSLVAVIRSEAEGIPAHA